MAAVTTDVRTMSPQETSNWCNSLALCGVKGRILRELQDQILKRQIDGLMFDKMLRSNALTELDIEELNARLALAIRRSWTTDFSGVTFIDYAASQAHFKNRISDEDPRRQRRDFLMGQEQANSQDFRSTRGRGLDSPGLEDANIDHSRSRGGPTSGGVDQWGGSTSSLHKKRPPMYSEAPGQYATPMPDYSQPRSHPHMDEDEYGEALSQEDRLKRQLFEKLLRNNPAVADMGIEELEARLALAMSDQLSQGYEDPRRRRAQDYSSFDQPQHRYADLRPPARGGIGDSYVGAEYSNSRVGARNSGAGLFDSGGPRDFPGMEESDDRFDRSRRTAPSDEGAGDWRGNLHSMRAGGSSNSTRMKVEASGPRGGYPTGNGQQQAFTRNAAQLFNEEGYAPAGPSFEEPPEDRPPTRSRRSAVPPTDNGWGGQSLGDALAPKAVGPGGNGSNSSAMQADMPVGGSRASGGARFEIGMVDEEPPPEQRPPTRSRVTAAPSDDGWAGQPLGDALGGGKVHSNGGASSSSGRAAVSGGPAKSSATGPDPGKSPEWIISWVRSLPESHVPEKSREVLSQIIEEQRLDGRDFSGWVQQIPPEVCAPKHAMKLKAAWSNVLKEAAAAEVALENLNSRPKQKATMIVV